MTAGSYLLAGYDKGPWFQNGQARKRQRNWLNLWRYGADGEIFANTSTEHDGWTVLFTAEHCPFHGSWTFNRTWSPP